MTTIAYVAKEIINDNSLFKESLLIGIASHAKLAEYIKPQIEKKLEKKININTNGGTLRINST